MVACQMWALWMTVGVWSACRLALRLQRLLGFWMRTDLGIVAFWVIVMVVS